MSAPLHNSDRERRREVDRLLGSHVAVTKETPILTALLDLLAWRLDVDCAILSLIDHKCQHLLATSTTAYHHKVGHSRDDLWHTTWPGRKDVLKEDIPCGQTINVTPIRDECTVFTVPDMSGDSRYCRLPLVSGPPFIRFYAGTPLRNSSGVAIGTIFVLDNKAREVMSQVHVEFLRETAQNVMEILDKFQSAEAHRVNESMLRGLTALFGNDSGMTRDVALASQGPGAVSAATQYDQSKGRTGNDSYPSQPRPLFHRSQAGGKNNAPLPQNESHSVPKGKISPPSPRAPLSSLALDMDNGLCTESRETEDPSQEVQNSSRSLSLGARILHAALQMDHNGGVVFLGSADLKITTTTKPVAEELKIENNKVDLSDQCNGPCAGDETHEPTNIGKSSASDSNRDDVHSDKSRLTQETMILGSCTTAADMDENGPNLVFSPLLSEELDRLITMYPAGNLWSLKAVTDMQPTLYDSRLIRESAAASEVVQVQESEVVLPKLTDAVLLTNKFPGARQVMFVPLGERALDLATSGCIIWSTSEHTKWSQDLELSFCITFCACILAKMARVDVVAAEHRRNAFVSSISHELRSPLHGILASADLLGETRCDVFQKSLVDTVDSCGRTLLDTINHVLDFSKMSSFGSNCLEIRAQSDAQSSTLDKFGNASSDFRTGGLLTVSAETNVAAICEEVVEGLVLGQHLREGPSFTPSSCSSLSSTIRSPWTRDGEGIASSSESRQTGDNRSKVEILLNIQKQDWLFVTQPGALRRITMNIFGNAIKYTEKGFIRVELQAQDVSNPSQSQGIGQGNGDACIVILTITDTGKGISKAFLRDHLYSPFAQEDSLAAGTGLGLSLVRSIVSMLSGTIDIQSEAGRGTKVSVRLPMRRNVQVAASQSPPDPGVSFRFRESDPIAVLRGLAEEKTIALFGMDSIEKENSTFKATGDTLAYYITEWYGLTHTSPWSSSSQSDILIADEVDLPALLAHGPKFPGSLAGPLLVILCSDAVKYGQTTVYDIGGGIIEFVTKPLGPYKLAKALYRCLQRAVDVRTVVPKPAATTPFTTSCKEPLIASSTPMPHQLRIPNSSPDFGAPNLVIPIKISSASNSQGPADNTAQLSPGSTAKSRGSAPVVLLVDDNKINLRLLETFVKKCQCRRVDTATNGQLAAQAVERSAGYDLIFMDISMPILNGFEATRLIRKMELDRSKTPGKIALIPRRSVIIALTGLASVRDRTEAFAAGVDLYLTKPLSLRHLKELLNRWNLYGQEGFLSIEATRTHMEPSVQ